MAEIEAEIAEIKSRVDARTPKDQSTVELIKEAGRWYKEPRFILVECEDSAKQLSSDGFPTDPHTLLRGGIEVMKGLKLRPEADQSFREYLHLYDMRRRDNPRIAGTDPMQHQAVIDLLVDQEKFGNNDSEKELEARKNQPLKVGQKVTLSSLSSANVRASTDDADLPDPLKLPNGTRAEIHGFEEDRYGRYVLLRILDGQYVGRRIDLSPMYIEAR